MAHRVVPPLGICPRLMSVYDRHQSDMSRTVESRQNRHARRRLLTHVMPGLKAFPTPRVGQRNKTETAMGKGHRSGYIRFNTLDQNAERQLDGIELDRTFTHRLAEGHEAPAVA